jgi:hypothetical protein
MSTVSAQQSVSDFAALTGAAALPAALEAASLAGGVQDSPASVAAPVVGRLVPRLPCGRGGLGSGRRHNRGFTCGRRHRLSGGCRLGCRRGLHRRWCRHGRRRWYRWGGAYCRQAPETVHEPVDLLHSSDHSTQATCVHVIDVVVVTARLSEVVQRQHRRIKRMCQTLSNAVELLNTSASSIREQLTS